MPVPLCAVGRAIAAETSATSGRMADVPTVVLGALAGAVVTLLVRVARVAMVGVLVVLVVLVAVRVVAWAGRVDPMGPAAVMMIRMMPQASATHADQVRTRMVPSLSFQRIKR
ncbi:MAG TPA: hypothetical protein VH021_19280 [Trebonia sp.]|nr:hypothetical protein [Trebonia sp.]